MTHLRRQGCFLTSNITDLSYSSLYSALCALALGKGGDSSSWLHNSSNCSFCLPTSPTPSASAQLAVLLVPPKPTGHLWSWLPVIIRLRFQSLHDTYSGIAPLHHVVWFYRQLGRPFWSKYSENICKQRRHNWVLEREILLWRDSGWLFPDLLVYKKEGRRHKIQVAFELWLFV